jgi:HAE1 family hydrophobic/amphiphilic exporter-1
MKLPQFSISRPLATLMIIVAMIFIGFVSLRGLPIDLFPELEYPAVTVEVPYPGAAPGEVESQITERVEEALARLEGVEKISSSSREGDSFVMVKFDWGTNLDTKAIDVREMVDRIKSAFPEDAEDPIVSKIDFISAETVLQFAVSKKLTPEERQRYSTD